MHQLINNATTHQLLKKGKASPFGRKGFHLAQFFEWLKVIWIWVSYTTTI